MEKNRLRPTASGYINAEGTGEFETIPCSMVLRSVGYRGVPLPDVPFNERRGTIPNEFGRVVTRVDEDGHGEQVVTGEYVVGWAKRGPTGVIGTNKPDAVDTVNSLLEDLRAGRLEGAPEPSPDCITKLLKSRNVRYVSAEEWQVLNKIEVEKGAEQERPRVKFTDLNEMLAVLDYKVSA